MKNILLILIMTILFSCTQYIAVTPVKVHSLILENTTVGLDLYELNGQIFIQNISSWLIIQLNYSVNGYDTIIYDIIVPNEKVYIANSERKSVDVIIQNVKFY